MEVDLSFGAELKASIDGLAASTAKMANELAAARRRANRLPTHNRVFAAGTSGAAGTFTLDLGSPQAGRYWLVRSIVVGGNSLTDTPAGTAYVLVVPAGVAGVAGILSMRDSTTEALPQVAFYTSEQMLLHAHEHLMILIDPATATTDYAAAATIEDWPDLVSSQELM